MQERNDGRTTDHPRRLWEAPAIERLGVTGDTGILPPKGSCACEFTIDGDRYGPS